MIYNESVPSPYCIATCSKNKVKALLGSDNRVRAVLAVLVLAGAFFRLYHFSDWLHFELDQARDAKVIVSAVEGGLGHLPLLGPRAGGTFLRLGPGFYYLEYLSALVFGSGPAGMGMAIPLLSIASIPVFFLFFRRCFNEALSLGMTALFSVSVFLVMYGRFAWNPNPLPFFLLLGFYALLRSVDGSEKRRGLWFLVAAASLGFATHLHFLAFVSLPAVAAVFLVLKRPSLSWMAWIGAVALVAAFYLPVALNEVLTGGANAGEFLEAVQGKSNKESHTLAEQFARNVSNHAAGFWTVLTGYEGAEMPGMIQSGTLSFDVKCDWGCREHWLSALSAIVLFAAGAALLVRAWLREKVPAKKDFLLLSLLWFGTCFSLFLPLSYDFAPRFFLLVAPFPFLWAALILSFAGSGPGRALRFRRAVAWGAIGILMASNLVFLTRRLSELHRAPAEFFEVAPDRILKEKTRVTLAQQEEVIEYMKSVRQENGHPIYMYSDPQYRRAIRFLMDRQGLPNDSFGTRSDVYANGNYFLVYRSVSNHDDRLRKYADAYVVREKRAFGTLTVFRLDPKPEAVTALAQDFSQARDRGPSAAPDRYTWKEWWENQKALFDDGGDDDAEVGEE
jgi:4-amino-4-deoxy-L-arabinose transferase-like glycosyltransferase